ncbi:hypothetical protein FIU87_16980 [Bacillus sp. THAF10]|uniref:glucosamine inositolphosphorylceramide transferase family protein n=1 Tax=Bacillus sp. THAF10 TaxID=2587848 RepID=UPI0012695E88|nr:hypothetical protein [Bacillus sp. THAF10]QFT90336.1 hypothetical protein FIU87_16980 [Bacillus sp. THAF10]
MNRKKIRFAIIINETFIEKWKLNCIDQMIEMEDMRLALVIIHTHNNKATSRLYRLYEAYLSKRSNLFKKAHIHSTASKIPIHVCTLTINKRDTFSNDDLKFMKGMDLDFILDLGSHHESRKLTDVAKRGVWTYHFSSSDVEWNAPAGLKEVQDNLVVNEVGLYMHGEREEYWIPLKKGYLPTISESLRKNTESLYRATAGFPAQVCKEMFFKKNYTFALKEEYSPIYTSRQITTGAKIGELLYQTTIRKAKRLFKKMFCYEFWNIGIVYQPIDEFLKEKHPHIQWIHPGKRCYYADPFGYHKDTSLRILMEEVNHKKVKGFISDIHFREVSASNESSSWNQSIMKMDTHMSYPYIVKDQDAIYCIPETSEKKEASLYKEVGGKWKKCKTILKDFAAVDSTIIKHKGRYWLFCTKANTAPGSDNYELHIFYANKLFDNWLPHHANPVKMDIRSSRPAGTPFIKDGVLYRPAQDCSKTYGGRIVINRIITLTPENFQEESVAYVEPRKDSIYPDGVHTISSIGDVTIFDGKRMDYSFSHLFRKIYKFKPIIKRNR